MKIVVLTGAGISAESGLRTFRGNDGLWENEPIDAGATPEGYFRDKKRVKDFYNKLRTSLPNFQPNAAHFALAELEKRLGKDFLLITQNVDDLHERAGSKRVLHMHGYLKELRCEQNENHVFPFDGNETLETRCPFCGKASRPHIVWFGEIPLFMDEIEKALRAVLPPEKSSDVCHRLVLHGRAVCDARKPRCENCCVKHLCKEFSGE